MNGFQLSYEIVLMLSVHKKKNFHISNFKKKMGLETQFCNEESKFLKTT